MVAGVKSSPALFLLEFVGIALTPSQIGNSSESATHLWTGTHITASLPLPDLRFH